MRVSHKHKLIFISTPKSGSHSGFELMEKNFNGVKHGSFHETRIPPNCHNYRIFTFVRNPYERFVALYHSLVISGGPRNQEYRRNILKIIGQECIYKFGEYMSTVINNFPPGINSFHVRPQYFHLNRSNVPLNKIKIIHIENVDEEFNKWLGHKENYIIPHNLKREHMLWKDVKTPELTYNVNKWAGKDFELFNYKKEEY